MTQSSCKHDTKSNSHPSVKLAPVRVFSCKHPLLSKISSLLEIWGEILAPFCSTDSTLNTPNISRICQESSEHNSANISPSICINLLVPGKGAFFTLFLLTIPVHVIISYNSSGLHELAKATFFTTCFQSTVFAKM